MNKRRCARCGETFTPKSKNQQVCSKTHYKKCENCGGNFPWHKRNKTCSKKCTGELKWSNRLTFEKIRRKECLYCGDIFYGPSDNNGYCDKKHFLNCASCNNIFTIPKTKLNRPPKTCSPSCSSALGHNEESEELRRRNNFEKYGVEHTFQRMDVKAKIALNQNSINSRIGGIVFQNNLKNKYGVNNISQVMKEHLLGVNNPANRPEVKESIRLTNIERYGYPTILNTPEVKIKAQEAIKNTLKSGRISKINRTLAERLKKELKVEIEFEKNIGGYYYDLYINDHNILIDVNPTISHNITRSYSCIMEKCIDSCQNNRHRKIEKDYHQKRFIGGVSNGMLLFSLFDFNGEDELIYYIKEILEESGKVEARSLNEVSEITIDGDDFHSLYENYWVVTNYFYRIKEIEVIKSPEAHHMVNRSEVIAPPPDNVLEVYDCGVIKVCF